MKGFQEHPRLGKALKLGTAGILGIGGATAADKAATGQFPWEQFNQKPIATLVQKSPMPSETAYETQLTETPTVSPAATPATSPSVEPSPTPSPTPSATEVPPINEVPLNPDGVLKMEGSPYAPYYYLLVSRGTITAKEYDSQTKALTKIAVTFPGSKITRQNCVYGVIAAHTVKLCSFTGETLWLNVTPRSKVQSPNFSQIGRGPDVLDKNTAVGQSIDASIPVSPQAADFYPIVTSAEMTANAASFTKLQNDVGNSRPRSQKDFALTPGSFSVSP